VSECVFVCLGLDLGLGLCYGVRMYVCACEGTFSSGACGGALDGTFISSTCAVCARGPKPNSDDTKLTWAVWRLSWLLARQHSRVRASLLDIARQ